MKDYSLVLSDSKIIISGLSLLLKDNNIIPVVRSGTISGYNLTLDMDELYVKNLDLKKAKSHIASYKKQIRKGA